MAQTPDKIFKYCSISTARKMLETTTIRWSAPALFNDPFEPDHTLSPGFDQESLLDSAIKLATAMIFSADNPRGDSPLVNAIKRWREEERFATPEEAEGVLRELLTKMVDQRTEYVDKILKVWVDYNRATRICCFCPRPDNILAWDKFAENHSGVCLRLDTGDQAMAGKPVPVRYTADKPALVSMKEQLNTLLFSVADKKPDFESLLTAKPLIRKPEQEWRSFRRAKNTSVPEDPNQWYDDIRFDNSELSALCFGAATSDADKKSILKLVKENFRPARVFQSTIASNKFELELIKL